MKELALRRYSIARDTSVPRYPIELEVNGTRVRMSREQAQMLGRHLGMASDPGEDEEFPMVAIFPEPQWPDFT